MDKSSEAVCSADVPFLIKNTLPGVGLPTTQKILSIDCDTG